MTIERTVVVNKLMLQSVIMINFSSHCDLFYHEYSALSSVFLVTGNHLVTLEFPEVLLFRELGNAFGCFIIPSITAAMEPQ